MKIKRITFRDHNAEQKIFVHRIFICFILIVFLLLLLLINLYNLQIVKFNIYNVRSNKNRIKLLPISPLRGIIYDRNGIKLAVNQNFYQVELLPEKVISLNKTLKNLQNILNISDIDINIFKKKYINSHGKINYVKLKHSLNDIQIAKFSVNQHKFPEVEIKKYPCRYYPYGSILTHVIGYVAKINNSDLLNLNKKGIVSNYIATNDIGKLGIEKYYENILRGKIGYEEVEVNNKGNIIRRLNKHEPITGEDIYLTIDIQLQKYIDKLLNDRRAVVIVSNPNNGDILALVSKPSYDPNLFTQGISIKQYQSLLNNKDHPLFNRAVQASYPPASTVKPYIAVSALNTKIIEPNTILFDPGWWQIPGSLKRYRDWKKIGHGYLNIKKSLEESSDTFFYQIAYDMGIENLSCWMNKFGYGQPTGIDLPQENQAIMPNKSWKMQHLHQPWYQGDTISVGIGQGYWTATPIQMNKALMILINNGKIIVPHLLLASKKNGNIIPYKLPNIKLINNIYSKYWQIVKDGMYGVANRLNGTAYKTFFDAPYKIAAKSGTAQVFNLKSKDIYNVDKIDNKLRDHKLMIAFAPYNNPCIAVTIVLENANSYPTVGVIMRSILDYIMLNNNINTNLSFKNTFFKKNKG